MRYEKPSQHIFFGSEANPPRYRDGQHPEQDEILVIPVNETKPSDEGAPGK